MLPELVCPDCRGALETEPDGLACPACRASYPVREGVACFAAHDPFYESRYDSQPFEFVPRKRNPLDGLLFYLLADHYYHYIDKYIERPGAILDVACGAGARFLSTKGAVAGLDISFSALTRLDRSYGRAVQASAFRVPYPDGSFDYVVAKCFFEHVDPGKKPDLLSEFRRILKPGGRLIMLFDCDCENRLWLWAKRYPDLFKAACIDNDNHYGLMLPSRSLELLAENGFRRLAHYAPNKTPLVNLSMLGWLQAYRGKSRALDPFLALARVVSGRRLLSFAYNSAVSVWDDLVEPLLPLDKARYLLVACEKAAPQP